MFSNYLNTLNMKTKNFIYVVLFATTLNFLSTGCKTKLVVNNLEFETGKSEIKASALKSLDKVADIMGTKKYKIEVNGYTDSTGEKSFNEKLSKERALAVKNYLTGKGVNKGRVLTSGQGANSPIADNATETGRQKNRRTEIVIPWLRSFKYKKAGFLTRKTYLEIE